MILDAARTTLYGELAETITNLIEAGTFREGQRLPSIRTLSRQFGVSVNTVREAYGVLETQRVIVSRPQSGYFVKRRIPAFPAALAPVDLTTINPHEIIPCSLREEVPFLNAKRPYQGLNLAMGSADLGLLPSKRLNAFLGAVSREAGTEIMEHDTWKGLAELREMVAVTSLEAGIRLSPDDFVITSGCLIGVTLAVQVLCRPGDTIAVESPTYGEFLKLFKNLGLRVVEIPTSPRDGMSLEVLEWAMEKHTIKAVLTIPHFNNPVAFSMPEQRKKALVEMLTKRSVPLIEDDAYGDLSFFDKRPAACKAFDTAGIVIYCSSVSKTISPGYRVGWIAGGRWHEALIQLKGLYSAAASLPTQMAVARFLREGNYTRHLRTMRRRLADQTGAMAELVAQSFPTGTCLSRPGGGLFLWLELPQAVDTEDLYFRSAPEGIFFRPGIVFSASGKFRHHLRLCSGTWNPEIERAVIRLGELACTMV
jgi:DNA-binding transcriptional MocR family regulator